MKNSKSLLAALVLASATFGASPAFADDISTPPQALSLVGTSAFFGDSFGINNDGDTFMDQFTFNVVGDNHSLDAIVSSISRTAATGLDITGLGLYSSGGTLLTSGTMASSGVQDIWTLSADSLAVGSYYLQVSGTMMSNTSGSFGGSVMLNPVPEPETYGMMLAGLGVVGMIARRRRQGAAGK
jgi:hypothetical protein